MHISAFMHAVCTVYSKDLGGALPIHVKFSLFSPWSSECASVPIYLAADQSLGN